MNAYVELKMKASANLPTEANDAVAQKLREIEEIVFNANPKNERPWRGSR